MSQLHRRDEPGPRAFKWSPARRERWRFYLQACGVSSALLLAWATPSFADERHRAEATSPAGKHAATSNRENTGTRTIEAEVANIDAKAGLAQLRTERGELNLYLPPTVTAQLKKGDRVRLEMAAQQDTEPSALADESSATRDRRALGWLLLLFGMTERRR